MWAQFYWFLLLGRLNTEVGLVSKVMKHRNFSASFRKYSKYYIYWIRVIVLSFRALNPIPLSPLPKLNRKSSQLAPPWAPAHTSIRPSSHWVVILLSSKGMDIEPLNVWRSEGNAECCSLPLTTLLSRVSCSLLCVSGQLAHKLLGFCFHLLFCQRRTESTDAHHCIWLYCGYLNSGTHACAMLYPLSHLSMPNPSF